MQSQIKTFKLSMLLSLTLFSLQGLALDYNNSIGIGAHLDTVKEDLPANFDLKNETSPAATIGWRAIALWGNIGIRTGAFLEFKDVDIKDRAAPAGEDDIELRAYYAAIPLNLHFKLNNDWAFFGGITPRVLLAKTCEDCGRFDEDEKIIVNYYSGGLAYMFNNKLGADLVFHNAASEAFKGIKINTAQVLFHYEL